MPRLPTIRLASAATNRKRVFSRFALDRSDITSVGREVAVTYTANYEARLRQLGRQIGTTTRARVTDTDVLKRIASESRDAGAGIVSTHNDDLRRFVNGLDPKLSQRQMSAAVREWLAKRAEWKGKQIATTVAMQARNDADRDVISKNQIEPEARVVPRDSLHPACIALVDRGWMKPGAIDFALPLHPNCRHGFEYRTPLKNALADKPAIWLGDTIKRRQRAA